MAELVFSILGFLCILWKCTPLVKTLKTILFMADPSLQAGAALRAADQGIKSFNDV